MGKKIKIITITIVALLLVAIVCANVIPAIAFSDLLLEKDGWVDFENYLYGGQLKTESQWVTEKGEKIQVDNADGKTLTAIEVENEHVSHSYMIICHQYSGSPETMTEYAKHFYDLGFNIIMPYMRGHGESPYDNIYFGWGDQYDISEWIQWIINKDENAKIALFGVSLGANAVTLAAAEELPSNVRLVISDGSYTSFNDLMKEYIKNETHFSSIVTTGIMSGFVEKEIGVSLKTADTIEVLGDVELPIMFINGENDTVVPPLVSKRLYENCNAKGVEEVIIENGTHGRNLDADKETYWSNIDLFILNNIGI